MRRTLLLMAFGMTTLAQTTQVDPTQLKRPIKIGTALPASCTAGDLFFNTAGAPGANLYGCVTPNTWSLQGGLPSVLGSLSAASPLSFNGSTGQFTCPICLTAMPPLYYQTLQGNATAQTQRANLNFSTAFSVTDSSANNRTTVDMATITDPAWLSVTWTGGRLTGIPATFNAGQLQGRTMAATAPSDLQYLGWNNSLNQWEPKTLPPTPVSSVFGRSGAVMAQTGDYTTAQVTENGNLYFTNARVWASLSAAGPLTFNNSTGQFSCLTCLTSNAVPTVFGRSGAVTAQTGDYTFAQISGTVGSSQLPSAAMQTTQSNTVSAGTQDFHNAAHTLPMKSGPTANMPGACSVGEAYFATDAQAGSNVYGCTAANMWTPQGGTPYTVSTDGVVVGSSGAINFVTGAGLTNTTTNTGTQINVQIGLDSAVIQTQSREQSGTVLLCASMSGNSSNYTASMNPTLSAYTAGMVLQWQPDVNGAGGATTLNIDTLGALPVKLSDGHTNPGSSDIAAGHLMTIWYDGTVMRLQEPVTSQIQASIPPGTQDQVLNGTLGLTTLVNCVVAGGVYQYSTASHSFGCHTLTGADIAAAGTLSNNIAGSAAAITGSLSLSNTPLTTSQDILYDNAGSLGRLPIVPTGTCLGNTGGVWASLTCGGGSGSLFTSYQFGSGVPITGAGQYLQTTYPSIFSLSQTGSGSSGSPYIDAITLTSEPQNFVFAGPPSASGAPYFRALVSADVPNNAANTTGNAATATALAGSSVLPNGTTATTQNQDDGSTKVATTAYVDRLKTRAIGYVFDGAGAALSSGRNSYFTAPFACTITAWNMTVDTGTATVDVWKVATGTAIPTVSNTITAGATPVISSNTALHSTTLTGWTTSVSANDILGFNLKAVSSATNVSLVLECDQ